ncbi:MAG: GIY-YIG nuclease family protein [Pseudanabaenaceae cyanobacterium]
MQEGEVKRFTSSNVNSAPEASGIYAIYDETAWFEVAYIGRSNDIRRRLKEHLSGRGSQTMDTLIKAGHDLWFSFGYSNNPRGAEAAELARLSPAGKKRREIKHLE